MLWVALSACCFGTVPALTVLGTQDGSPLQSLQLWRYATSALLLGIAVSGVRSKIPEAERLPPAWRQFDITLLGGGAQFLVASLSLSALRWMPAATVAFLFYTYPAWVTLISAVRGIESVSRTRVLALLLALIGVAAMIGAPGEAVISPIGILLAFSSAIIYAVYIPTMSVRQRKTTPLAAAHAVAVGGTLCFLLWCAFSGVLFDVPALRTVLIGVTMGILTALAFYGFLTGLAGLGPVRTAITSTVEPIWTAILGLFMLGQPLGIGTVFGGAGILAAVVLLQLVRSQNTEEKFST